MYYKKFEHYLILCLIKQIISTVQVSGKPTDSEETKLFTNFVYSVCSEIIYLPDVPLDVETCEERLRVPDRRKKLPPLARVRCQTSAGVRVQIEPSESWQLVILVPQFANESDIRYSIIEPKTEFEIISITSVTNFTIWSTILDGSPHMTWYGGQHVPAFKTPPYKKYEVKHKFRTSPYNAKVVNGWFTWNITGGNDGCFDVVNYCGEDKYQKVKIWPAAKNNEPQVMFHNLTMEKRCELIVNGLYGETRYKYHTPDCDHECLKIQSVPEFAKNLVITAVEDSPYTWKVRVSWSPPRLYPDQYNVTLRATHVLNKTVPWDATEAVFDGVVGESEGLFNVSVYSILGTTTAHSSRRAKFPARAGAGRRRRGAGAGGAALIACAAAAATLALLCRCRRKTQHVPLQVHKPEEKPVKEETEVLEVWRETEDRWEVRVDKLVLHEVIGEGAFGVVRRATLAPQAQHVAVKMLKDFPSMDEIRSFRSEMELMKSVGVHPHLVSLVGCCSGRNPLIIAEYCSRGDLLSYLRCTWDVMLSTRNAKYYNNNIDTSDYRNDLFKCRDQMEDSKLVVNKLYEFQEICDKELTPSDLLSFCRQIAMGMEFLAANRVVHRDLAARNILVTADRTLKIADFGLSRDVYEENQYKQKGNGKMPVKWMALESLTRRIYTTQSDVWSFGVVVWEVATVGGSPYSGVPAARLPRLLRTGYRMPKPINCSNQLYDIMLSCWRVNPRDRPTFAELHSRLDSLLNTACAEQYLSLEIDADDTPPTPKHHRYFNMFLRGKLKWTRGENYERPLKAPQSNHYTSPPDAHPA